MNEFGPPARWCTKETIERLKQRSKAVTVWAVPPNSRQYLVESLTRYWNSAEVRYRMRLRGLPEMEITQLVYQTLRPGQVVWYCRQERQVYNTDRTESWVKLRI